MRAWREIWALVALLAWLSMGWCGGEIPRVVFCMEDEDGTWMPRVELTGGAEAYWKAWGPLRKGTAVEGSGKDLRLEFPGEAGGKPMVLTLTHREGHWLDAGGNRWVPREEALKVDASWTPVRIALTTQDGKALGTFRFEYRIEWAKGNWRPLLVRPVEVKADEKFIEFKAPAECAIHLSIDHPDCVRGYGEGVGLERKDGAATLSGKVRFGRRVKGTVVSDSTGKPVEGVVVSPLVFTPPAFTEDLDRAVVTGPDGAFELRGVDVGFAVQHRDYLEEQVHLDEPVEGIQEVRLKAGETIRGTVRDTDGNPLADVEVEDGSGKSAVTAADGSFVLRGLRKWSGENWWLEFSREGYNEVSLRPETVGPEGLTVELVRLPELRGRVVLADGSPVGRYRIVGGPGPKPGGFECVEVDVEDEDGRFAIRPEGLPEEGEEFWIGVQARNAAVWEKVVKLTELKSGEFRIVLEEGAALSATVQGPAAAKGPFNVVLTAVDREPPHEFIASDHPGVELASRKVRVEKGAALRIPHLRAGEYRLRVSGEKATPVSRLLTIGKDDLDLGVLRLRGTGTIVGQVNEPYERKTPWRFADGQVYVEGFDDPYEPYLQFKTDENGRFRVEGVPSGVVSVSFSYMVTADIMDAIARQARVVEGQVSEVRFGGGLGAWTQPLRLLFDGKEGIPVLETKREVENVTNRPAMFRLAVSELGDGKASWSGSEDWSADDKKPPAIPDLSPGRWKIGVYDWLGSRGFNDEGLRGEVEVEIGEARTPQTIELGSRALTEQVASARETRRLVRVVAAGRANKRLFYSRGDHEGDFIIRYLPEDEYAVHAHDDEGGWCDLGTYRLGKAVVDCGEHQLEAGGHVEGTLDRKLAARLRASEVRAVGMDGVVVPLDEIEADGSYRFGHLKPGKWTIRVIGGDRVLASHPVEVRKGETVALPAVTDPAEAP